MLLAVVLTALAFGAFLFSPPPAGQDRNLRFYVPLFDGGGMLVNGDAESYLVYARRLDLLLTRDSRRQSRPLYLLAGEVSGLLVQHLTGWKTRIAYFWGYLALNFLQLTIAIAIFLGIAHSDGGDPVLAAAIAPFLAFNNVTKNFIYTPHEQMFILLTPLLAVLLCAKTLRNPGGLNVSSATINGFTCGLLATAYGNFILIGPCLLVAHFLRLRAEKTLSPRSLLLPSAVLIVTMAIPTIIWAAIATHFTGKYYNHEMAAYRQLIWVIDAAMSNTRTLAQAVLENSRLFLIRSSPRKKHITC